MSASNDRSHLIVAWTESWPLVSEFAFRRCFTTFDDRAPTEAMFDELTEWLRPRARGHSLETLHLIREQVWPPHTDRGASMASWLRTLADRYLECDGAVVRVRGPGPGVDDSSDRPTMARRWRALTLMLPEDLLVGACARDRVGGSGVSLLSDHLQRLLHRGAAETHVHLGGATHFATLWSSVMGALRSEAHKNLGRVASGDRDPFLTEGSLRGALTLAACGRVLLGCFLQLGDPLRDRSPRGFADWLDGLLNDPAAIRVLGDRVEAEKTLVAVVEGLRSGRIPRSVEGLLRRYRQMAGWSAAAQPDRLRELIARDPLYDIFHAAEAPEGELVRRGLRYLDVGNDSLFSTVFWQYQRLRVRVFRWVTQEPGTAGLDWFGLHMERSRSLRCGMEHCMFESALVLAGADTTLLAFEARTTPPRRWYELREWVERIAYLQLCLASEAPGALEARLGSAPTSPPGDEGEANVAPRCDRSVPEVGLIVHLRKEAERTTAKRSSRRRSSDGLPRGARYARWYRDREAEVQAIVRALQQSPELLLLLRGIDVAGREVAVPWWPIVGLIQRLRDASEEAVVLARQRLPGCELHPLRATYHAGEDFRRLVSGLRSMHELLEFGMLRQGERIGHGIALGVDVSDWILRNPVSFQPREERLWDLAWELRRYERGEVPAVAGRVAYLHGEMRQLGEEIFRTKVGVEDLMTLRRDLHDPELLAEHGYPMSFTETERESLLGVWLWNPGVWADARKPIQVRTLPSEEAVLCESQRFLAAELSRHEITLEACPSSNLLVSDGAGIEGHHALRLRARAREAGDGGMSVFVSVSSDDPLAFHAALAHEFEQLYAALLRDGVSAEDTLAWINRVRETGYRSRFTLPGSRDPDALRALLHRRKMDDAPTGC